MVLGYLHYFPVIHHVETNIVTTFYLGVVLLG